MTEQDYLPTKDSEFAGWGTNFADVAGDNEVALHLTVAQVSTFSGLASAFVDANAAVAAAKKAAATATTARRVARKALVANARMLVRQIQGTAGIPDTLKTDLGITVNGGRRPVVPVEQPAHLKAEVRPDLRIYLKWDKNGNGYGCLYTIERKAETDAVWTTLRTQTSTRFYDATCPPGIQMTYRVTASRGTVNSMPSAPAVVY